MSLKVNLEHRKNNRVIFSIPIQYKVFDLKSLEKDVQDNALGLKAAIEDLSLGGIQVVSGKPFKEGEVLELELNVPKAGPTRTVAKVIWSREEANEGKKEYRTGIQFIPVFEEDLKKVKSYFDEMGKGK